MLWVVQKDLHARNQKYNLIEALTRLDIPFIEVDVDKNTITPDIPAGDSEPIITNGSIMLSNIGKAKGWVPGSLFNDAVVDSVELPRAKARGFLFRWKQPSSS